MPHPIYLDYNATTPHAPEVIAAMRPFLENEFGNPSSSHSYGAVAQNAVDKAREEVAALLGCRTGEIVFTSGGTEANNFAIKGVAFAYKNRGNHIITSQVEHPAVLEVCRYLEKWGFKTTYLPVDSNGRVSSTQVADAIRAETILISIMHANNEVGTIQPVDEIARLARGNGIIVHTDAAQSIGKIPVNVKKLGVDLLSVAGHKLYAPKGIGALFIKEPIRPEILIHGAGQEMGKRAGTENVLEIVGLGKACKVAGDFLQDFSKHMLKMRDLLYDGLKKGLPQVRLNGHPEHRLPNTLSLSFRGLVADRILAEIGPEVAASAGAACHADTVEISHVLEAMKVPVEWARGTIRLSTGRMTTRSEINRAVGIIVDSVKRLSMIDPGNSMLCSRRPAT